MWVPQADPKIKTWVQVIVLGINPGSLQGVGSRQKGVCL